MQCEQCETLLAQFLFDELDDASKTQVMAHLSDCAACSEKLGDLRVTIRLVHEGVAALPEPKLSEKKRAKLMKKLAKPAQPRRLRLRKDTQPPAWLTWLRQRPGSLAAAAGIAIAVGIGALLLNTAGRSYEMSPVRAGSDTDSYAVHMSKDGRQPRVVELHESDPRVTESFRTEYSRPSDESLYNRPAGPPVVYFGDSESPDHGRLSLSTATRTGTTGGYESASLARGGDEAETARGVAGGVYTRQPGFGMEGEAKSLDDINGPTRWHDYGTTPAGESSFGVNASKLAKGSPDGRAGGAHWAEEGIVSGEGRWESGQTERKKYAASVQKAEELLSNSLADQDRPAIPDATVRFDVPSRESDLKRYVELNLVEAPDELTTLALADDSRSMSSATNGTEIPRRYRESVSNYYKQSVPEDESRFSKGLDVNRPGGYAAEGWKNGPGDSNSDSAGDDDGLPVPKTDPMVLSGPASGNGSQPGTPRVTTTLSKSPAPAPTPSPEYSARIVEPGEKLAIRGTMAEDNPTISLGVRPSTEDKTPELISGVASQNQPTSPFEPSQNSSFKAGRFDDKPSNGQGERGRGDAETDRFGRPVSNYTINDQIAQQGQSQRQNQGVGPDGGQAQQQGGRGPALFAGGGIQSGPEDSPPSSQPGRDGKWGIDAGGKEHADAKSLDTFTRTRTEDEKLGGQIAEKHRELDELKDWTRTQPEFINRQTQSDNDELSALKDQREKLQELYDFHTYEARRTNDNPAVKDTLRRLAQVDDAIRTYDGSAKVEMEESPNVERKLAEKKISQLQSEIKDLEGKRGGDTTWSYIQPGDESGLSTPTTGKDGSKALAPIVLPEGESAEMSGRELALGREVTRLQFELEQRREETLKQGEQIVQLEEANHELEASRATLTRARRLAAEQKVALEEEMRELRGKWETLPIDGHTARSTDPGSYVPESPIRAQVTDVQKSGDTMLAQINVGSVGQVQEGQKFLLHRGEEYLGTLRIVTTDDDKAVGRVETIKGGAEIRAGDQSLAGRLDPHEDEGFSIRKAKQHLVEVPKFTGAPEFDLNSAMSNSNSGKSSGGSTTLFGESSGRSSTTLFSDSDYDGEQITRAEMIEQLTTLVQDTVGDTSEWAAYGGEVSSLRELNGNLIVKTTPENHRKIQELLTKLRGKKPDESAARFTRSPNDRRTLDRLDNQIEVRFEKTKLADAVEHLRQSTGANFYVNWNALEAAGVEQDLQVNLKLRNVTAEQAMNLLLKQAGGAALEPIGFDVRDGIVQLSTKRDLMRTTETEIYNVADLMGQQSAATIEHVQQALSAEQAAKDAAHQAQVEALERARQQEQQRLAEIIARDKAEAAARAAAQAAAEAEQRRIAEEQARRDAAAKQRADLARGETESGELMPSASYKVVPVNPWTLAEQDHQSTFALDVDTASYNLARRYIHRGYLPPIGSVRMEEFINAMDYNYPCQTDGVFSILVEAGPAPFAPAEAPATKLVKVAVRGKVVGRDGRKPANIVLVIDASGSMAKNDRLPLVQQSLKMLTGQLNPTDTVALVAFGNEAYTLLDPTPATQRDRILKAIDSIQPSGQTNLLKGLQAGYQVASQSHKSGASNKLILCSDGIATLGESEADAILQYVDGYRQQGVTCTTVGFGAGAYNDDVMEKLANKGDGTYYFVDSVREAQRVFVDDLTATLQTIAKDAKIQVEFNPQRVRRYRLIGYENRAIADKDFRNDTIDAGEVGSGKSSTALYEVELTGDEKQDLGTVYVRYRNTDTNQIEEINQPLTGSMIQDRTPRSDPRFYLAACAAEFAELLRESEHAKGGDLRRVQGLLGQAVSQLPLDERATELLELVTKAQGLPRAP